MFSKIKMFLSVAVLMLITAILPAHVFAVLNASTSAGWNIFTPSIPGGDYRYGPSMIINSDGSIDAWFSATGDYSIGEWDYISYKRSTDGGQTWSTEQIVLRPTVGGYDHFSTCDPGVVKFGGYYYIGYTTTQNPKGPDCDICVARSTSPTGPFEKWNGSGWGGNPQPFITHDGPTYNYGSGEPSFVVKDGTLYIYYSWMSEDANGNHINQTRVATVSSTDPNWPGNITYRGVAINRSRGEDSTDIKYIDTYNKFVGLSTYKRFSPHARINMWESTDGLTFVPSNPPKSNVVFYCNNLGITGTETGHIDTSKNNKIAYAYGNQLPFWYTYMQPITYSNNSLPAIPEAQVVHSGNGQAAVYFETVPASSYKIKYGTSSGSYTQTITGITSSPYTVTGLTNGTAYYFTVVATNAYGDSSNSNQLQATPENYTNVTLTGAFASSQISGWEVSKVFDNDIYTTWSSTAHVSSYTCIADEWIAVDTGGNRAMGRIILTARQRNELCTPAKFHIECSLDGSNWTKVDTDESYYLYTTYGRHVLTLKQPVYARYIRVFATSLGHDGTVNGDGTQNFYFQLGEIDVEEVPFSAICSSEISGWSSINAIDAYGGTCWSSVYHASANSTEWIGVNMGYSRKVTGIRLNPRQGPAGTCFPVDFKLQYSSNGSTWIDISGQSYTNYPNPGSNIQDFKFSTPVTARYIRLYATKLSADQYGGYYCQITDFYIDDDVKLTPAASSSLSGWEVSKVADNRADSWWSSSIYSDGSHTEWVSVDLGSAQYVSSLDLIPRIVGSALCFPKNFKLQYSNNGSTWTDIPGHQYISYDYTYVEGTQKFVFETLINVRYFRVYATKLTSDDFGNYAFQLGGISVNP